VCRQRIRSTQLRGDRSKLCSVDVIACQSCR